jgi:hypothetical protein
MILLEINRAFENWDRLLGEHRWKEFLRKPTDEEEPRVSRIYYSRFKSGREAQKEGKCVEILLCSATFLTTHSTRLRLEEIRRER